MAALPLLGVTADRLALRNTLARNLCRCGSQQRILNALDHVLTGRDLAQAHRDASNDGPMGVVPQGSTGHDIHGRTFPGILHGRMVHPEALVS